MRWLGSLTDSMDMNLSKLWEIVKDSGTWSVESLVSQKVGHDLVTEQERVKT